jgi:hypothetical protein
MKLSEIINEIERAKNRLMATSVVLEGYVPEDNQVLQGTIDVIEDVFDDLGALEENLTKEQQKLTEKKGISAPQEISKLVQFPGNRNGKHQETRQPEQELELA